MIHVLVNLLGLTILAQQTPEHTHPPHPQDLGGEPSLPGTPTLTIARVTSLLLGLMGSPCTGPGVNLLGLLDNEPILDQLTDFSRELAMEISLTSLGSSQTLPLPHLSTLEASRFCSLRETIAAAAA
ncbi:Os03g0579550, partial [Oryza sativa Japonica Group]